MPIPDTPSPRRKPRQTRTLTRARARIKHVATDTLYGGVQYWSDITPLDDGPHLTSRLPDGRHAPVLDVDGPVTCTPTEHGTTVLFAGRFRRPQLEKAIARLRASGLVDAERTPGERRGPQTRRWHRRARWVQVAFDCPVVAVGSTTPGHFHLLVQKAMTWDDAKKLAELLADAGVVDKRFERVSALGDFMYVRTPPGPHDTIAS